MSRPTGSFSSRRYDNNCFEMDGGELLDRLQFHDHDAFDQEIGTKAFVEVHTVELERNSRLPLNTQAAPLQLPRQYNLINRF